MNFDPRSARLSTEVGLIIESPEMAAQLQNLADEGSSGYRLRLGSEGGRIEWVALDDAGHEAVFRENPETSAWRRFRLRMLAPFIPEAEL